MRGTAVWRSVRTHWGGLTASVGSRGRGGSVTNPGIPGRRVSVCLLALLVACVVALGMGANAWAQATTLFSDGFETGIVGWSLNPRVDWLLGVPSNGTYCVRLRLDGYMERTVSTVCYDNVTVSFYMGANSIEAGETVRALWYNGASWTVLKSIGDGDPEEDGALHYFQYTLPAGAANNANFGIRFEINGNSNGDMGYVDDVVVAADIIQYGLDLTGTGVGSVTVNGVPRTLPWSGSFNCGTVVSLQAVPDSCYAFANWSGDLGGSVNPTTITMDGSKAVAANFNILQYALNLTGVGNGSVTVNATPQTLPWSGNFNCDSVVNLVAVPDPGWDFAGWSGDISWSGSTVAVTVDSVKNITATFTVQPVLSLTAGGTGSGSVTVNGTPHTLPWSGPFPANSSVIVAAVPDAGSGFTGWTGDVTWPTSPLTVVMNSSKNITVNFDAVLCTLSLTAAGSGSGSVTVNGTPHTLPWSGPFALGSVVSLAAVADAGSLFDDWSGDLGGSANPTTITMDSNKAVVVSFRSAALYQLSVSAAGNGSVTVDASGVTLPWDGDYDPDTVVALEATGDAGWQFDGWTGDVTSTDNPLDVTMDSDVSVVANFSQIMYDLNVTMVGNGSIEVDGTPEAMPYTQSFVVGTEVELRGVPDYAWRFDNWSGDASGTDATMTVTVDGDMDVVGTFIIPATYELTVIMTPSPGAVEVNGVDIELSPPDWEWSAYYAPATGVTLAAVIDPIEDFLGWDIYLADGTGPSAVAGNPFQITMDWDKTVYANFVCVARFPDVPCDYWSYFEVEAACVAEIAQGYPDGFYQPRWTVDRASMAVYIARALAGGAGAVPTGPVEATFDDVPTDFWAFKEVEYTVAEGVVEGYGDGNYRPEWACSRGQMAVFIAHALGYFGDEASYRDAEGNSLVTEDLFPDVPVGYWCDAEVACCVDNGVVSGYTDGFYRPAWVVSRDQMAVFIARAFELPM